MFNKTLPIRANHKFLSQKTLQPQQSLEEIALEVKALPFLHDIYDMDDAKL